MNYAELMTALGIGTLLSKAFDVAVTAVKESRDAKREKETKAERLQRKIYEWEAVARATRAIAMQHGASMEELPPDPKDG